MFWKHRISDICDNQTRLLFFEIMQYLPKLMKIKFMNFKIVIRIEIKMILSDHQDFDL